MKPYKLKPIHEVRFGFIKAVIWKNENESRAFYNVTFTRLYKEGQQWQTTGSFGRDDLLLLAKVADEAHSWICESSLKEQGKAQAIPPEMSNKQIVSKEDDSTI
jgi:hypothetical protein